MKGGSALEDMEDEEDVSLKYHDVSDYVSEVTFLIVDVPMMLNEEVNVTHIHSIL